MSRSGLLGSQLVGYGLAGIMRSFLVYPTFAIYPHIIPPVQLFDTLHRGKTAVLQKQRLRFFWIVFVAIFVWEWFPECAPAFSARRDSGLTLT